MVPVNRDLSADNERNNNVGPINEPLYVSVREESMLANMLNNLTRSRNDVMKHIAGAAPNLRGNLHAIQYGITLLMEKYDGHTIDVYKTKDFRKLAKEVFGFISEQTSGRKIFCVTVSSPIMGPSTFYFAYYLTARAVKAEEIKLMVPFLESLTDESLTADIEIDNETNDLVTDETVHKTEPKPPAYVAPTSLPMAPQSLPIVPFSPIANETAVRTKPTLVRQQALVKQSTETEVESEEIPRPTDIEGFWMDNGSEFSIEADRWNGEKAKAEKAAKVEAEEAAKTEGKCCIHCNPEPQIIPGNNFASQATVDILNEIFKAEMPVNCPISASTTPAHPEASISAAQSGLPQEVLDITPINTTPSAVKKAHRNAKSRLSGRKGSRQPQQFNQQQRRNSFGQLPSQVNTLDMAQMNFTVPLHSNLNQTLDEIMNRLSNLETSLKTNVSHKKSHSYHKFPSNKQK